MKEKGEEEKRARAVKAVTVPRIQTVAPSRDTEAGKFIDPKPVLVPKRGNQQGGRPTASHVLGGRREIPQRGERVGPAPGQRRRRGSH